MSLDKCIQKARESALKVREDLGVSHREVSIIKRVWAGKHPGDGKAKDTVKKISPTPIIKEIAHDIRIMEGGAVKQGDLIISQILKKDYPLESDVDGKSDEKNIEYLYKVGDYYYNCIHVKDKFDTWNVQVRRTVDERGY